VALAMAYFSARKLRSVPTGSAKQETERQQRFGVWPWVGLIAGVIVVVPIFLYEAESGWPMLRHRLSDTQHGAGLALRNALALVGGQLLYLSPVFAVFAAIVARDLFRARSQDPAARLLFLAFAVPLLPLTALCLWSPVAEPHWLAPALLALPIHAASESGGLVTHKGRAPEGRAGRARRRLFIGGAAVAGVITAAAYTWVLLPATARLRPAETDARLDIASELYGWPIAIGAVKEQLKAASSPFDPEGREVVIVGPHWTICAQLQAALPDHRVGCATPIPDDFDLWLPREQWRKAERVLYLTDNRFPGDGASELPEHVQAARSRVRVLRGGRTARVFELFLYERRAQGLRDLRDRVPREWRGPAAPWRAGELSKLIYGPLPSEGDARREVD
jgi:hypothetical protein